jgi:hypothetical protein
MTDVSGEFLSYTEQGRTESSRRFALTDHTRYRRLIGVLLGAGIGLTYGLVSQIINYIALPGIHFYQPPLGTVGNTVLCVFVGASLGLVNAWLSDAVASTFLGSATGALMITISSLLAGGLDLDVIFSKAAMTAFIFLPIAAVLVPLLALHRWATNKEIEARIDSIPAQRRVLAPLALLILAGIVGAFSLYPARARIVISRMNTMLQTGITTSDVSGLPTPLQSDRVGGFLQQAQGSYTLEWDNTDINRFAIPRRMVERPDESVVIARFENGWMLVCLFPNADAEPSCKGFDDQEPSPVQVYSAPSLKSATGTF